MNIIRPRLRTAVLAALGLVMSGVVAHANNVKITDLRLTDRNDSQAYIGFDISWENSWRNHVNHDAAWVFFKVRKAGEYNWRHIRLDGQGVNPEGYLTGQGTPVELVVPEDRVGMFVRRAEFGQGPVAVGRIWVLWNFAEMGFDRTDEVEMRAFGVEMVYVAEGPFWVGSGFPIGAAATQETRPFTDGAWAGSGSSTSFPFRIISEDALEIGPEPGKLWAAGMIDPEGTLPAEFPKGYQAFYSMKYQVTQAQYVDFLNSLPRAHQARYVRATAFEVGKYAMGGGDTMVGRNGIRAMAVPDAPAPAIFGCDFNGNMIFNEEGDGQDLAMNYLDAWFNSAIADWMGLRWMTELEFEKAARGPLPPVPGEFAWGNTNIVRTLLANIVNDGRGDATATVGNCSFNASPLVRVGLWAMSDPPTTREQAGASYWGIMELTGNLSERMISLNVVGGHIWGRQYTGLHGDGELSPTGWGNVVNWPYINGGYSGGIAERGGNYSQGLASGSSGARISDRTRGLHNNVGTWTATYGFRAVRTAPTGLHP